MASVIPLARAIGSLRGWRRNALAFILGVMATLALAPFYYFPLLLPSFSGLVWLLDAAPSRRRMFFDGWWWGWGFYMSGLYWFCIALLTDAEKFAWLIPFALFGLTGVIAIYCGVAAWAMSWIRVRGLSRLVVFTAVWTCVEFARGHLFTGFPWNLAGYSFGFSDASLQMASLVGAYGLTWFAVLLATTPVALGVKKYGAIYAGLVWGVFFIGMFWGAGRLHQANAIPEEQRYVKDVLLRLVQANIAQPHKWDPKLQMRGLEEHIALTQSEGLDKVTHVIWPETAVPFIVGQGESITKVLGKAVPEGKLLITGTLRSQGEGEAWKIWNSLMAINHDGAIVDTYDKVHLVPFGEFLPFRKLLPKSWLTPVGDTDFSTGEAGRLVQWPGLPPAQPLICYEVIFPEMAHIAGEKPGFLLSVTNDAWFGLSTGPHQHFEMARIRAVEQGVPLIRVANTGISAVVDGFGQVLSVMPLGEKGFLDVKLPLPLVGDTIYTRINNIIIPFLMVLIVLLIIKQRKQRKY